MLTLLFSFSFVNDFSRYNTGAAIPILPPFNNNTATCNSLSAGWTVTKDGYYEACGGAAGDVGQFTNLTMEEAQHQCCLNSKCAGFSYAKGSGFYKEVKRNCTYSLPVAYFFIFFK